MPIVTKLSKICKDCGNKYVPRGRHCSFCDRCQREHFKEGRRKIRLKWKESNALT